MASVLNSAPRTYWQLGDASGTTTTAADEVDDNLGTDNGTYSNVTLGVAGPLAGSSETRPASTAPARRCRSPTTW